MNARPFKLYELENMKITLDSKIDRTALSGLNTNFEMFMNEYTDQIIFRLRARLAGQKLEEVVARWPADWWEALKERWFPAWLQKWFPVRWKTSMLKSIALYPQMVIPNWKTHVVQQRESHEGYKIEN